MCVLISFIELSASRTTPVRNRPRLGACGASLIQTLSTLIPSLCMGNSFLLLFFVISPTFLGIHAPRPLDFSLPRSSPHASATQHKAMRLSVPQSTYEDARHLQLSYRELWWSTLALLGLSNSLHSRLSL